MKKIYCSITLFLFICYAAGQTMEDFPLKLRMGTYNVGHFNQGMKGGLELKGRNASEEFKKNNARMEMLNWRKWISEQSLDIFILNEWNQYFDTDSIFMAEKELLQPFYNHIYWGDEHTWIFNGIATNFTLTNIRQKYWAGEYYALIADLNLGKKTITIISTHLPWQKEWHAKAVDSLIAEMKKYKYLICMGDMNATDAEQLRFGEEGFNIANGGNQGWFPTGRSSLQLRGLSDSPDRHLDNIITSSNIKIMNISAPFTRLNDFDHLPVLADVIITD